jgi:hypothetical protein
MSVARSGCGGCVLSDGRFTVFGGRLADMSDFAYTSSGEALVFDWTPLQPMHDARAHFACVAVAECIIVAGGLRRTSAEVYDEALCRWLRLPCNLPHYSGYCVIDSALM